MFDVQTCQTRLEQLPKGQAGSVRTLGLKQLRRLHALWRRWTGKLRLSPKADRQLRHYYIRLFSQGRAYETRELTESGAAEVIRWLAKLVRLAEGPANYAAGTAGRHGYPERRQIGPNEAAWRALWECAAALGMERPDLENFIRRHYAGAGLVKGAAPVGGLRGLADLRTMADLNRVLWGLKAMLRRRSREELSFYANQRAA